MCVDVRPVALTPYDRMAWEQYLFLAGQLAQCDGKIDCTLAQFPGTGQGELADSGRKTKSQPGFNVRNQLFEVFGMDVTEISGFKGTTALTVFFGDGA